MKIFLTLLIVGFTSATLEEEIQNEAKNAIAAFANGLQTATPLYIVLDVEDSNDVQRLEREMKEELKKHFEEAFEKPLKKLEDAVHYKKEVNKRAVKMMREQREKVKSNDIKEELDVFKVKMDENLRMVSENMRIFDERSTDSDVPDIMEGVLGDISVKEMLSKLKKWILEKVNVKTFRDAIAKIIGLATKKLCEWITDKGQGKFLDFFDHYLDLDSENKKRSTDDLYEEIKDYLKNIEENLGNNLAKFKKWLHDLLDSGIDKAKEKVQKVSEIIKKIIAESKNLSRKELNDALEHIQEFEYK